MDANFFDRLYKGYAAEHLISGELYARSFEVFRLPADFGFDLVVTNSFRASAQQSTPEAAFQFCLQVKSRRLRADDIGRTGANGRPEAKCSFWFSQREIDLIASHEHAAVAFVMYFPDSERHPPKYFLIHARDIVQLINHRYLRPLPDGYELAVTYVMRPQADLENILDGLLASGEITQAGADRLKKIVPATFDKNWNARPYFKFARESHKLGDNRALSKMMEPVTDFAEFPRFPTLILR